MLACGLIFLTIWKRPWINGGMQFRPPLLQMRTMHEAIYLLDTGVLSAYLRGRPKIVTLVEPWILTDEAATSILVYGEIIEYLRSFADVAQRRTNLQDALVDIQPLPLDYPIMERYADLRRMMRPPHGPGLIGDVDTLIAATAQVHHLTVVTADSDHTRVPQLQVQLIERSWLKAQILCTCLSTPRRFVLRGCQAVQPIGIKVRTQDEAQPGVDR